MKFEIKNNLHISQDPFVQKAIEDKLFATEKTISLVRFVIVLLNLSLYHFIPSGGDTPHWFADSIILLAIAYSVYFVLFHPYQKFQLLLTRYITTVADAVFIVLWITATGGKDSPFYLLWYVSIITVAMRFSMIVTLRIAFLYAITYFLIFWIDTNFSDLRTISSDFIFRTGYLIILSLLAGLMSQQRMDYKEAKLSIKKVKERIRKKEYALQDSVQLEAKIMERIKELEESNKRLIRINEEMDNFVYSTTHDLKSPIQNIEALIQLLFQEEPPHTEHGKDIKERLAKSIMKMKKTVDKLVEAARAHKEDYNDVEAVKFEEVLREVITENEEIIKRENAQLEFNFNQASYIHCSRTCIKSVMYNFLTNSLKYKSPERPPVVRFHTEKDKDSITLFVKDNGLGMDLKNNRQKLFTIFKRFHNHVEGSGIGLYTVKKLVEKNHGDIDVESAPNEGSTFKVKFKTRLS